MTPSQIDNDITHELQLEGGLSHDPTDKGGLTNSGISQKANPDVDVAHLTEQQKREIYLQRYVKGPGLDQITDTKLQAQLIDYAVNSGPAIAIMKLQDILHVTADGVLGPETLAALKTIHPEDVNLQLAVARIKMLGKLVTKSPAQLKFLSGWLDRACQFILD